MAGSFHLVGHSNKTCQENKARYFMPTYILGIKDSKASSFILILNPQKENLQIILAPNFTILVAQHQEIFILPLCIIIFYCLYFLHFLCDHWCFSMTGFRADLYGPVHSLQLSFCYNSLFLVILSFPWSLDGLQCGNCPVHQSCLPATPPHTHTELKFWGMLPGFLCTWTQTDSSQKHILVFKELWSQCSL